MATDKKRFSEFVIVTVFSTREQIIPLETEAAKELVSRVGHYMRRSFGGATAIPGSGFYLHRDGVTETDEAVTLVYSFFDRDAMTDAKLDALDVFIEELRVEYGQESVAVIDNGGMFFIE